MSSILYRKAARPKDLAGNGSTPTQQFKIPLGPITGAVLGSPEFSLGDLGHSNLYTVKWFAFGHKVNSGL